MPELELWVLQEGQRRGLRLPAVDTAGARVHVLWRRRVGMRACVVCRVTCARQGTALWLVDAARKHTHRDTPLPRAPCLATVHAHTALAPCSSRAWHGPHRGARPCRRAAHSTAPRATPPRCSHCSHQRSRRCARTQRRQQPPTQHCLLVGRGI
jgi:hypothetical protein